MLQREFYPAPGGEVWLEGEKVSECYGLQAKITYNKEDVALCGQMGVDYKVKSYKGTGSLRMHKVSSRMAKLIGEKIRDGPGRAVHHHLEAGRPRQLRR